MVEKQDSINTTMTVNPFTLQLVVGALIGLGAGYVGSFMILKKMSLVGDALSHVALPGIALALLFQFNPFLGAFGALFVAIVAIWSLEKNTELPPETLVGIMFTSALAIGLLITPEPELLEALFGNISKVSQIDFWITTALTIFVITTMIRIAKPVMLGIISKDLSRSMNPKIDKINFLFLSLVSIIVALGLKVVGTLLMGSMVIIPAAAAKNVSINLSKYNFLSGFFGIVSSVAGIMIANRFGLQPGPIVVLSAGTIFLATLFFKK